VRNRTRAEHWVFRGIVLVASLVAILSARPYAGSWNDGSRLATVECLVDRGTLVIDDSIFVKVPRTTPSPYAFDFELLQTFGTKDKLFIDGHFYSDKSPVLAFYLAGVYKAWRLGGGASAAERPDLFCWFMTIASSGLAYVVAVGCFFLIGRRVGLELRWNGLLTGFFALGTVALPYAQFVNNHILLLAIAALLLVALLNAAEFGWTARRLIGIGTLTGIGYTIDLAAGPALCLVVGSALLTMLERKRLWIVILAALPWVLFHHIVNFQTGGTFGPANAVPEYLAWPGSPFSSATMTGGWHHDSAAKAIIYALDMLFGKKGFLGHNLILFLPMLLTHLLIAKRYQERRWVRAGLAWTVATWLLYAATSNNQSGACCSVRWFVPLLAPGFLACAVLLRDHAWARTDASILGIGGLLLGIGMAYRGAWFGRIIPLYWPIYIGTLMCWGAYRAALWKRAHKSRGQAQTKAGGIPDFGAKRKAA
jgi:hypothetical protein